MFLIYNKTTTSFLMIDCLLPWAIDLCRKLTDKLREETPTVQDNGSGKKYW